MQLDEFVKTTLMQIAKGVKEAQSEALEYGAIINPPPVNNDSRPKATNVSFDVALTVSETSSGEAGGGLKVAAILSVGAKALEIPSFLETQIIPSVLVYKRCWRR